MKLVNQAINFYRLRKVWLGDGGKPVVPELAQKRADVCRTCPHNQEMPIWELFAGSVAFAVKQQLRLKSEMKLRVNGEEDLHVCSACLCILSLKVHTPLRFILDGTSAEVLNDLHQDQPRCWLLTEKQNLQHDHKNSRIQEQ